MIDNIVFIWQINPFAASHDYNHFKSYLENILYNIFSNRERNLNRITYLAFKASRVARFAILCIDATMNLKWLQCTSNKWTPVHTNIGITFMSKDVGPCCINVIQMFCVYWGIYKSRTNRITIECEIRENLNKRKLPDLQ